MDDMMTLRKGVQEGTLERTVQMCMNGYRQNDELWVGLLRFELDKHGKAQSGHLQVQHKSFLHT